MDKGNASSFPIAVTEVICGVDNLVEIDSQRVRPLLYNDIKLARETIDHIVEFAFTVDLSVSHDASKYSSVIQATHECVTAEVKFLEYWRLRSRVEEENGFVVELELRELAAAKLSKEKPDQSVQPTMLVHEAYLRLVDVDRRLPCEPQPG